MTLTPSQVRRLVQAATKARKQAYAPYSKFQVGAALLTTGGKIVTGCNVENASYGLSICAERVAVGNAVSTGHRKFRAMAVVATGKNVMPCGACRQVLAEFGDMPVICADVAGTRRYHVYQLSELLSHAFKLC